MLLFKRIKLSLSSSKGKLSNVPYTSAAVLYILLVGFVHAVCSLIISGLIHPTRKCTQSFFPPPICTQFLYADIHKKCKVVSAMPLALLTVIIGSAVHFSVVGCLDKAHSWLINYFRLDLGCLNNPTLTLEVCVYIVRTLAFVCLGFLCRSWCCTWWLSLCLSRRQK